MNFSKIIDFIVVALLLIIGVFFTYMYSIKIVITFIISILGAWYFVTGVFTENKKYEAFIKTSMYRVIIGGFMLIIGIPLLILCTIDDARIALIASISIIILTVLTCYYTERK